MADRYISICPGRGKAAICTNCGGLKEWHKKGTITFKIRGDGLFVALRDKDSYFMFADSVRHPICSHYEPLRLKVKSVMMESEWLERKARETAYTGDMRDWAVNNPINDRQIKAHEARAEGGKNATWAWLQDALYGKGGYPKGTPMAVITFERRKP